MIDSLLAKWGNFVFLPFFLLSVVFVSEILSWSLDRVCVLSVGQSWPTLCDLKDCSPPGFSVHRVSQVRILEWVAISFSRRSCQPGDRTPVSCISRQILYHWATREAPYPLLPLKYCWQLTFTVGSKELSAYIPPIATKWGCFLCSRVALGRGKVEGLEGCEHSVGPC